MKHAITNREPSQHAPAGDDCPVVALVGEVVETGSGGGRTDDTGPTLAGVDMSPPIPAARSSPSSRPSRSLKAASRAGSLGRTSGSAAKHCSNRAFSSARRPSPPGVPSARTHHGMGSPSSAATSSTLLPSRPGRPPRRPRKGTWSAVARRCPRNSADWRSPASQWKGGVPPVSSSYARLPTMYTSLAVVAGVLSLAAPAHTSGALHCRRETSEVSERRQKANRKLARGHIKAST
jgi:hypothetical protein